MALSILYAFHCLNPAKAGANFPTTGKWILNSTKSVKIIPQ